MVHAQQADLHFLMARNGFLAALAEALADVICEANADIQQTPFADGLIKCHSGFHHMPGTVEFVTLQEVCPTVLRFLNGEIRVQVAVRLLTKTNKCNNAVDTIFKVSVLFECQ